MLVKKYLKIVQAFLFNLSGPRRFEIYSELPLCSKKVTELK